MGKDSIFIMTGDIGMNRPGRPDSIFDGVRAALSEADLLFGQLEVNLADCGSPAAQCNLPMRGAPEGAGAIARAGYDVLSYASNHCLDWGREALYQTLDILHASGVATIGAGVNITEARKPYITNVGGTTIAILGYNTIIPQSYHATASKPGCAPMRAITYYEQIEHDQPGTPCRIHTFARREDLQALLADIAAIRSQVDIVAISMHWGIHFIPAIIADYQREVAHAALDNGADMIIGHHAHILKPIEIYKGKTIIYSLANFALDPPNAFDEHLEERDSHAQMKTLNQTWAKSGKKMPPDSYKSMYCRCIIGDGRIKDVAFAPVQLDDDSNPRTLTAADPEFSDIVRYMTGITEDQGIDTEFVVDGNWFRALAR
jgi:poly-gamma-glutamate capsule biosynthesis protein CapA/YwtB (metallophosphatase superfamily)